MWNGHRNYLHLSAPAHPGNEHPPQSEVAPTSLFKSMTPVRAHIQTNVCASPAVVENEVGRLLLSTFKF